MSEPEVSKTRQPRQLVLPFTSFEQDCNLLFLMPFKSDKVYDATEEELHRYWRMRYGSEVTARTSGESSPETEART